MNNPHDITKQFEAALCEYTGARYAVAVNSCTMALLLACHWYFRKPTEFKPTVEIPCRTYVSVPQSIIRAGFDVAFRDEEWKGAYQLDPLPVWDCARRFTSGMYRGSSYLGIVPDALGAAWEETKIVDHSGDMLCVSFHASKILGDSQGGAILHDNPEADAWFRKARFDGRTEGVDPKNDRFDMIGWHCYMSPDVAARLLWKLSVLPKHNVDLPNSDYPDLSTMEIFK